MSKLICLLFLKYNLIFSKSIAVQLIVARLAACSLLYLTIWFQINNSILGLLSSHRNSVIETNWTYFGGQNETIKYTFYQALNVFLAPRTHYHRKLFSSIQLSKFFKAQTSALSATLRFLTTASTSLKHRSFVTSKAKFRSSVTHVPHSL